MSFWTYIFICKLFSVLKRSKRTLFFQANKSDVRDVTRCNVRFRDVTRIFTVRFILSLWITIILVFFIKLDRKYFFNIDSTVLKLYFLLKSATYSPRGDFWNYLFLRWLFLSLVLFNLVTKFVVILSIISGCRISDCCQFKYDHLVLVYVVKEHPECMCQVNYKIVVS